MASDLVFVHEPRVVTDTPGYGEAVFAIRRPQLQALETKQQILELQPNPKKLTSITISA